MSHHALLEYIRRAKKCGADEAQIIGRLKDSGWYEVDVKDGLELYHKLIGPVQEKCEPEPEVPKPSVVERIIPSTYDPYIIPIAVISFILGIVAYVIFR